MSVREEIKSYSEKAAFLSLCCLLFFLPFSKTLIEVFFSISLGFWLIKKIAEKDFSLPKTYLNWPILIFIAFCSLSFIYSEFPYRNFRGILKILEYITLYFIVVDVFNSKSRFKILIYTILSSVVLVSLDGLYQKFIGHDLVRNFPFRDRVQATFKNSNDLATFLGINIPLIVLLLKYKSKQRIFTFFIALIAFITLLYTYSRGVYLSFFIVFALWLIFLKFNKKTLLWFLALVLILFIIPSSFSHRLIKFEEVVNLKNLRHHERIYILRHAFEMYKDRPLIGWGINTYNNISPRYFPTKSSKEEPIAHYMGTPYAHNGYLQMAIEIGVIGLLVYLSIFFILFKKSFYFIKRHPEDYFLQGLLLGVMVLMFNALWDTPLTAIQSVTIFWIFIGLTVARQKTQEGKL